MSHEFCVDNSRVQGIYGNPGSLEPFGQFSCKKNISQFALVVRFSFVIAVIAV